MTRLKYVEVGEVLRASMSYRNWFQKGDLVIVVDKGRQAATASNGYLIRVVIPPRTKSVGVFSGRFNRTNTKIDVDSVTP